MEQEWAGYSFKYPSSLSLLNADEFSIFCKTKNMSEVKREQLGILTILVHIKKGAIIVKCS